MVELTRDMADDLEQASVILQALAEGMLAGGHNPGLRNEVQKLQGNLNEYAARVPNQIDPLRPKGLPDDSEKWRPVAVRERRSQMGDFLPK